MPLDRSLYVCDECGRELHIVWFGEVFEDDSGRRYPVLSSEVGEVRIICKACRDNSTWIDISTLSNRESEWKQEQANREIDYVRAYDDFKRAYSNDSNSKWTREVFDKLFTSK
jgi:hypothetical protein